MLSDRKETYAGCVQDKGGSPLRLFFKLKHSQVKKNNTLQGFPACSHTRKRSSVEMFAEEGPIAKLPRLITNHKLMRASTCCSHTPTAAYPGAPACVSAEVSTAVFGLSHMPTETMQDSYLCHPKSRNVAH